MGFNYVEVREVKLNIINSIGIKNIRFLYVQPTFSERDRKAVNFKKYFYFSIHFLCYATTKLRFVFDSSK
jgi:hypothetical protein